MTKIEALGANFSRVKMDDAVWVRITESDDSYVIPASEYKAAPDRLRQMVHPTDEDFILDVLAAPYGGAFDGRDVHGQFFDESTNFHDDLLPFPPVFYYHGEATRQKAEVDGDTHASDIGRTVKRWRDGSGLWFRTELNKDHELTPRLMEAAKAGRLYASTGVVPAKHRVCDLETVRQGQCEKEGHIRDWLIGELSLIDVDPEAGRFPANLYAMAFPALKCACADAEKAEQIFGEPIELSETVTLALDERVKPTNEGDEKAMTKMDKLKAALASFMKMFDEPDDDATEKMADKPDAGVNPDHGDERGHIKCGCSGNDETQKGAMGADSEQVRALQSQLQQMQSAQAAAEDGSYLDGLVRSGKLTPAEKDGQLKAFATARTADALLKDGSTPMLATLKAALEARPSRHQFQNPESELRLAGFSDPNQSGAVDPSYVAKMRASAGVKGAKQNG